MQKKPLSRSSSTVASLLLAAASMPFTVTSASAEDGYSGVSGLAKREIIRRKQAVVEADRLFMEGREAYAKKDYQQATDNYRKALSTLPPAPTLDDRRQSYTEHLSDASIALSQEYRKVGKYDEAKSLLDSVLAPDVDPDNFAAKTELGYLEDPIRTNPSLTYEHTENVDQVRRELYMAQGNYDLGKFDEAKSNYETVLRIDPYNTAARRGMEKVSAAKTDYYRAAYDHTRAELLMQVDQAWELSVPADVPNFGGGLGSGNPSSEGVAYITEKLRRIVIPRIDFEDTTVEEAVDFLRQRAAELDTLELDPAKKGVNFVIRRPRSATVGGGDSGFDTGSDPLLGGGDPGALRIDELRLRNVPLAVALKYIGDKTRLRYKVDDFAVTLVPQTEEGEDLFTRTFRVPPDFAGALNAAGGGGGGGGGAIDPFAETSSGGPDQLTPRPPIIDLLRQSGIVFADGSSATLGTSGNLLVTNTPSELDKVEQLVEVYANRQPKQVKITTKFVEISQENADELGFDWIVSPFTLEANRLFGSGGTIGSGVTRTAADFVNPSIPGIPSGADESVSNIVTGGNRSGNSAINRNSINSILNNPNRSAQSASVAPGILGLTGLFSGGEVQVIMRGLSQKKGTDLMTAPSVTAKSGQKATIEVIREFIYPTEYEPPEVPDNIGGGGNSSLLGLSQPSVIPVTPATPTAFETKNTGVTLEIEPTIGENDFVIDIRFLPEIVEFQGFINYGSPILAPSTDLAGNPVTSTLTENRIEMPVFSKRSVNTSLTIYDGYTVAVGGLMREDVQIIQDKVPILGDIPIVGRLFQTDAENRIKSNLIIFVTAEIIDATGRPLRGNNLEATTLPVNSGPDEGVLPPIDVLPD